MKVLIISALYPPFMLGGAENSARNLAEWLVTQGVDVAVIRATDTDETEGVEVNEAGVRVYRLRTMHLYAPYRFPTAASWKKPIYHLQDHFDIRVEKKLEEIIDDFIPDLVNIHMIQGVGYPLLRVLARRNIPVNYVLPDLGLACIRMSMFSNGKDCESHCTVCKISRNYKISLIRDLPRVGFLSPSRANLETLAKYFPVSDYPCIVLPNPNAYPPATAPRTESTTLRLLYAGRIHESKGVDILLRALDKLNSEGKKVDIKIAGHGQQEDELRAKFGEHDWCSFLGFVSQQELANLMMQADMLCIPSVWAENSPGVVIQALGNGLPVIGSNRGGIPELVLDGVNGRIVRDQTDDAWISAIRKIADGGEPMDVWRSNAALNAANFSQGVIGHKVLAWMRQIAQLTPSHTGRSS